MSGRLLPCPFCGGKGELNDARVDCKRCLATGPMEQYGQEDGANWNRRHLASQPSQPSGHGVKPCSTCSSPAGCVAIGKCAASAPAFPEERFWPSESTAMRLERCHAMLRLHPAPQLSDDTGTWNRGVAAAVQILMDRARQTRGGPRLAEIRACIAELRALYKPEGTTPKEPGATPGKKETSEPAPGELCPACIASRDKRIDSGKCTCVACIHCAQIGRHHSTCALQQHGGWIDLCPRPECVAAFARLTTGEDAPRCPPAPPPEPA